MVHASAPFTPEGRRRLASMIVDDGWNSSACCRTVPVLSGDCVAMVIPVSGWLIADRSQLTATTSAVTFVSTSRAGDHRAPVRQAGGRIASVTASGFPARRSVGCLAHFRCRCCTTSTKPPGCRCASRNRSATKPPSRASWCTSISRSRPDPGWRRKACSRASLSPGPACRLRPGQGSMCWSARFTRLHLPPPRRR